MRKSALLGSSKHGRAGEKDVHKRPARKIRTPDEVAALERENALLGAALDELLAREAEAESALASKSSKGLEEPPADE
ncbi:unnamed protein product, partial [Polarella glacialis]